MKKSSFSDSNIRSSCSKRKSGDGDRSGSSSPYNGNNNGSGTSNDDDHLNAELSPAASAAASASAPALCRVIAPSTLPEGTMFEAEVDAIKFLVTVPMGGVTKGVSFTVPYPTTVHSSVEAMPVVQQIVPFAASVAISSAEPLPPPAAAAAAAAATGGPVQVVQVIAPSTMNGGTVFEAQIVTNDGSNNGIKFMVTVPTSGVHKGGIITVPYPKITTNDNNNITYITGGGVPGVSVFEVPTQHWRTSLCDCCGVPSNPNCCLCLMAWCCTPILMAQVMRKMKYNFAGIPATGNGYQNVCSVITLLTILISVFLTVLSWTSAIISYLLLISWFMYLLIIYTCTRYSMRKKYKIDATCCNCDCCCGTTINPIEDCCCVYWCSCCTAIQLHSHTHDGSKYPYNPFTQTGLDMYAPEICNNDNENGGTTTTTHRHRGNNGVVTQTV